jgi:hypothetical protein
MIDTGKVADRRRLRFDTPAQLLADVDRIAASERAGRLRRTGNWTAGQTLGHLATWINYGYDGYPIKPPWIVKMILRGMKGRFMRGPMPAGKRIPKVEGGTLGVEPRTLDEGLAGFRAAWQRLQKSAPDKPNIIFGPLRHEEWIAMHLRHAELHLGFLHPE